MSPQKVNDSYVHQGKADQALRFSVINPEPADKPTHVYNSVIASQRVRQIALKPLVNPLRGQFSKVQSETDQISQKNFDDLQPLSYDDDDDDDKVGRNGGEGGPQINQSNQYQQNGDLGVQHMSDALSSSHRAHLKYQSEKPSDKRLYDENFSVSQLSP